MAINWVLALRGLQAVLALVMLGLMAYVATWWTNHWRQMSPTEINFMIFSPVWTLLALIYLVVAPMKFPAAAHKFAILGAEVLTMFYWFGGFIALAVFLSDRICFGTVCAVAKAGTAISAFSWAIWAITAIFTVLRTFRGGSRSMGSGEPKVEMHQGV
ncbi:hypothetical protein K469DRAFT_711419 [Zopfia rhizophila CBS 207.26]|uniref:MARVEL domain-containing protein n=1 Tax=Zopfia rhizophila CBS 207.26 TaxID=1314779 RepID=A0A6A6DT14_9PEZI|nr:hypothetical protein K469DRAFT_711419 [Zopfia rhizophila CBS 207.26]